MNEKKIIELKDIAVSFDGEPVLKHLDLSISDGEFVTLLGPSGCGKTTTLRIIAGFITPDNGDVFFDGKRVNDVPPYKRTVNTIFQRYALFPHLNVYENVAFGMRVQKKSKQEIDETILAEARVFGDDAAQCFSVGECEAAVKAGLLSALDGEMGAVIAGAVPGRTDDAQITVFDSTGIALQDLASAATILKKAERLEIGTVVEL